mmetsp:Transcript_59182/g.157182  ORF Transcript_59182/g.157182 Transcript_59182/m.157182 type:complete len:222 (+) Transcript_59182:444-1109(+)
MRTSSFTTPDINWRNPIQARGEGGECPGSFNSVYSFSIMLISNISKNNSSSKLNVVDRFSMSSLESGFGEKTWDCCLGTGRCLLTNLRGGGKADESDTTRRRGVKFSGKELRSTDCDLWNGRSQSLHAATSRPALHCCLHSVKPAISDALSLRPDFSAASSWSALASMFFSVVCCCIVVLKFVLEVCVGKVFRPQFMHQQTINGNPIFRSAPKDTRGFGAN